MARRSFWELLRRPEGRKEKADESKESLLAPLRSRNRPPLLATHPVDPGERAARGPALPAAFRESHRRLFWIGCTGLFRGARGIRSHGRAPARSTAALVADPGTTDRGRLLRAAAFSLFARGCAST